jgi:hypothetical protein
MALVALCQSAESLLMLFSHKLKQLQCSTKSSATRHQAAQQFRRGYASAPILWQTDFTYLKVSLRRRDASGLPARRRGQAFSDDAGVELDFCLIFAP